ncbi:hypothetical protein ACFOZ7_05620 [Natribaculum luteum]|uniref:Uncharacterized protein n=1 Tax=Natribaculum luteum TaxID=1586232 RepID=A0ABD5NWT9_9EURY|nr:hypothetical protein [Natribaculum luteum]
MQIGGTGVEQEIMLTPDKPFINEQNTVQPGDENTPAYHFKGQEGYVLFIPAGTLFAPILRDANGNLLDDSTRIIFQKMNKQGDKLGNGIVLNELFGKFNVEKFRNDPDYMRYTQADLMLDERERAGIFLDIPDGAEAFDPDSSELSIGDTTSEFRTPVEVVDHDDLTNEESAAVKRASQANGGQ